MSAAILILAGGGSARMGQAKQLLPFGDGTLLGHVVTAALDAACGPVFVVLGANAEAVRKSIEGRGLHFIPNEDWRAGIGSSISAGIGALQRLQPALSRVMILLADQPRIDAALIRAFMEASAAAPGRIVAASYAGTIGVPAVFPAGCFAELLALSPEQGAKPLLERHAGELRIIGLASNPDIDTPEDYQRLNAGRDPA